MIYQLGQVSNRDTQLLYFYRILRHSSTELSALYRYDNPDVFLLDSANEIYIDDEVWFEYRLACSPVDNRIPYLEFICDNEVELKHIEDLVEVETKPNELIIRGRTDKLTDATSVAVYWLPSLAYIEQLQDNIKSQIDNLKNRAKEYQNLIKNITISSDYVLNLNGNVPNLVNIGKDETGLIYDDSGYMLSGSVAEQTLINPPQRLVSSLLKSHVGTLTINDVSTAQKVYQGFYGGCIKLSGNYTTLVLKDITSIVLLNGIKADTVIIENCPAVMFRRDIRFEGSSKDIGRLEVRNSYLTINQRINIHDIWCYRRSTIVLMKGTIHTVGFVEAGSSLIYDTPNEHNTIEEIKTSALQGLFYTSNAPEEQPYLDEIFMAQKPISFQRGQVDDPVPISEANVSIELKHHGKPGPGPGPSPGGKIYSPFTDWYWSGDSRTVGIIDATGTDGKGYVGESLPKLREVQGEIESEGNQHNIILWWGVNGLSYGASDYADVYRDIADNVGSNAMVFVGTVGHCPDGTGSGKVDGGGGQDLGPFNDEIEQFNEDLKAALGNVANVHVLDIDSYIKELEQDKGAAWLTNDNLHYKPAASQMIYDWVCNQITNVDPGDFPDAPTDTNAGRIWNWFKYANIPNVSNRPELIAGIIGNCQQESYNAIDLLGQNGTYYGPWCESQVGFRNTVTAAGYSFHQYTPSPGDDSAAIPTIFTWLTQQSGSWVNWLAGVIDQVSSQTGEAGARAFAELFCVCIERCVGGADAVIDPGVHQIMVNYYGGTVYLYQDLGNRRDNAAAIYHQFMGI
jgi:hypothetical protein